MIIAYSFFLISIAAGFIFYSRGIGIYNPITLFIASNLIIILPTFYFIDTKIEADFLYIKVLTLSLASFIFGAYLFIRFCSLKLLEKKFKLFINCEIKPIEKIQLKIAIIFLVTSVVISSFYFYKIGYNLFSSSLLHINLGNFSLMRTNMYSGINYYYPGYVNQFKNILLPITFFILLAFIYFNKRLKLFYYICVIGALFLPYYLLGTGQRLFFIYSMATCLSVFFFIGIKKVKYYLLIFFYTFILFVFMTYFYKLQQNNFFEAKQSQISTKQSQISKSLFGKVIDRFSSEEQISGIKSFRVISQMKIDFLDNWNDEFKGIALSNKGSYIEHYLFRLRHGEDRGTEAISTAASCFYNGGFFLVFLFYFIYGVLCSLTYKNFISSNKTPVDIVLYSMLFIYMGTLTSGGPIMLLRYGVFTIFLYLLLNKLALKFLKN